MPKYKFYIEPGFTVSQWYQFNLAPELVYDYFTSGSDSLLFGSYATPEEIASGAVHRWLQVYPGVSRDMAIEYDIWDHKYRRKLKGDLTFLNNQNTLDYNILADIIDTSLEVKIRIEQTCVTTASDWWPGYFSIVDGSWDSDRGLFIVNPSPDDAYRLLEELGDHEYNLYDLNPTVQAQINFVDITEYAYSSCTALDDTQWQEYHDPQGNYTYPYSYPELWSDPTPYVLIDTTACDGGNVYTWSRSLGQTYDFGNSRGLLLEDAIQYLVNTIAGLDYDSTFFENNEYPTGDPNIPIGTKNYVTLTDPNPLNGMVIYQKSDIRLTSDRATLWNITFNNLMDILKTMFNVDWFIDDDGKFRIEHWSYFDTAASDIDLTLLDGGKWINKKNKWSYDLQDMPNREHFEFAEANAIDFFGRDIIYNSIATFNRYKDNIKSFSIPVTTDAKYMYNNSADISNEGWALLTVGSDNIILNEIGLLSGVELPNNHLSWANLHYNYHRHGRIISKGNMNGSDITFLSYQRKIKQEEITYPECCGTFDPMAYKVTELGEGEVRAAEYRLIDGSVKTVFFYLDVKASGFPMPETYYLLTDGINYFLHNGGALVWYG